MIENEPIPHPTLNGPSGGERDPGGRFAKGNPGGKGNPMARHVNRLRVALLKSVKPGDLREVMTALVTKARSGDVAATSLLLTRLLGPPVDADLIARLERLETLFQERGSRGLATEN